MQKIGQNHKKQVVLFIGLFEKGDDENKLTAKKWFIRYLFLISSFKETHVVVVEGRGGILP